MIQVYIIRHGNTFLADQTPLRVGLGTDIPLVPSGQKQAQELGIYFSKLGIAPRALFSSALLRARETAQLIQEAGDYTSLSLQVRPELNEIDHGPDEGKPEHVVEERLGAAVMEKWNKEAIMPDEWTPRPKQIIQEWETLLNHVVSNIKEGAVLMVTSNGRARFVPGIPGMVLGQEFQSNSDLKLRTGSFGILEKADENSPWQLRKWNIRP
jgi:probable phosphoglycerate mutase